MPKLFVTGGGGFVAGSVIQQAPPDWEVHAASGKAPLASRPGLVWHTLDLKDANAVADLLARVGPDVTIHAAAIADIDFCENHPDVAALVNVELTAALARHCRRRDTRMVFLSTDTVFDGIRGNYTEDDPPAPINVYARTKAEGEAIVERSVGNRVIARPALVMGFGLLGRGNSFLERTVPMLKERRTIFVPQEEIRTPIDVVTLGRALLELAASAFRGTIHLAGNEALDRVALTRRVALRFGFSPEQVVPRSAEEISGRAPRPRDVSLNNGKARSLLSTPMRDLDSAFDAILSAGPPDGAPSPGD